MQATLEQETEQAVETPEVNPLQEVLNRMNDRDSQESADIPDEATEVEASESAPEPVANVEGPSVAMRTLAKQYGVDEDLLGLAQTDEQVELLIEKTVKDREPEKAPEPPAEPELELEWPEGEFDADDPIRKNITALKEHTAKKLDDIYGYLGQLANVALESKKSLEQQTELTQAAAEQEFDEFVDSLSSPQLGNRAKGDVTDLAQGFRYAMFQKFDSEQKSNPRASRREILERVAKEAGFSSPQRAKVEAIKASSQSILGGLNGNGPPAPPKQLTPFQQFQQKLAEVNGRPHNKES